MRKAYTCKTCNHVTSVYDKNCANSPLFHCPYCYAKSYSTPVEDWADISWISFDQDIERSINDGSFDKTFTKITDHESKPEDTTP